MNIRPYQPRPVRRIPCPRRRYRTGTRLRSCLSRRPVRRSLPVNPRIAPHSEFNEKKEAPNLARVNSLLASAELDLKQVSFRLGHQTTNLTSSTIFLGYSFSQVSMSTMGTSACLSWREMAPFSGMRKVN